MTKTKQVQIPLDVFYCLYDMCYDYIYNPYTERDNYYFRVGEVLTQLEKKYNSLKLREAFTKYKTEQNSDKQADLYEEYQDVCAACSWEELKLIQKLRNEELKFHTKNLVQTEKIN